MKTKNRNQLRHYVSKSPYSRLAEVCTNAEVKVYENVNLDHRVPGRPNRVLMQRIAPIRGILESVFIRPWDPLGLAPRDPAREPW